jgi:hypothetical protein
MNNNNKSCNNKTSEPEKNDKSKTMQNVLDYFDKLEPHSERHLFIDEFLKMCTSNDLNYLSKKVDDCKRDFICLLPNELIEIVLKHLDWKSLLCCCQVRKKIKKEEKNLMIVFFL